MATLFNKSKFKWKECHWGHVISSELWTVFKFIFWEEIPLTVVDLILIYVGPMRKKQFTTTASIYEFQQESNDWITCATSCDITFLTTWYDNLEVSWGNEVIHVYRRIKKKEWGVMVTRGTRVKKMLANLKSNTYIFGIRFKSTELIAEKCTIFFHREQGVVFSDVLVLFSLRHKKLMLLVGKNVLNVIDKVKQKNKVEICMDIIHIDTLQEVPMSIKFTRDAEETIVKLKKLLKSTRYFGFEDEIELRFYSASCLD